MISERGDGDQYSRVVKVLGSMKAVEKRLLLLGPEPWKAYTDKDPDDYQCCAGGRYDECGCGGLTVREASDEKRKDLPPVKSIRIEKRTVTTAAWEPVAAEPTRVEGP